MIDTAPEDPEFANSISISFGNLESSPVTAISGFSIAAYGLNSVPWVMLCFGGLALIALLIKEFCKSKSLLKNNR
jgi:predicted MFS family arabinose efflux permease